MIVRLATEAAPGRAENEDNAFHAGRLVGVLDGVTEPVGVDTGCVHSPAWYVHRLTTHLADVAGRLGESLADTLAEAIRRVRADHGGRCDLTNPATPAATVCLIRVHHDRFDYLILSDSHLVTEIGGRVQAFTDPRFQIAVTRLRSELLVPGSAEGDVERRELTLHKYRLTNRPGGYWVAAATPQAARHAITGSLPLTGPDRVRRAALLTDGAACAVTEYRLMTWAGLLDLLTDHGPHELIRRVRRAEDADPDRRAHPRFKRHDDATAVLCAF
ncbi:MAG TPA: hypothetical protein VF174_08460 [Micromonosporaceae bacterium]